MSQNHLAISTHLESRVSAEKVGKRDAILFAALQLFVERGFHGVPVPEIARRAEVAAGTIYRYFDSKEELVNMLYQELKGEIIKSVLSTMPDSTGFEDIFEHAFSSIWSYLAGCPLSFRFLELHHHQDYLDEDSRALESQLYSFAEHAITAGQESGLVEKGDPITIGSIAYGIFVGVARAAAEGRVVLSDETRNVTREACWRVFSSRTS